MGEPRDIPVISRADGKVLYLILNRPQVLNALSAELLHILDSQIRDAAARGDVRVIVITGSGDRAFSVGADIGELAGITPTKAYDLLNRGQRVFRSLELLHIPSIAALNGHTLGGGLELALSCSLIFASEKAHIGFPEIGLGLIPGYGGTQRLPRLIGEKTALRLMLTGKPINAWEAYESGILSGRPVPGIDLMAHVEEVAQQIAKGSSIAARMILDAVKSGIDGSLEAGLAHENALAALAMASDDGAEGVDAFREKRPSNFTGA